MNLTNSSAETGKTLDRQVADTSTMKPPDIELEALKPAAKYLQNQGIIGDDFHQPGKNPRYVDLNLNALFMSLRDMYSKLFQGYTYRKLVKSVSYCTLPEDYANKPSEYAAAVYISSFIHDLFIMNRECVRKLYIGHSGHYFECDSCYISKLSNEYDSFLCQLAACLRPTNIKTSHEDTLYIPRFHPNPDFNRKDCNYFDVPGFVRDQTCLNGIIWTWRPRRSILKFYPWPQNTLGRPFWLFDWHTDGSIYAWFRQQDYSLEDVTLAYILGLSCTPHLAPRDYDEWQLFPGNVVPENVLISDYRRVRPLTYHGRVEYNDIEQQTNLSFPKELRELVRVYNAHDTPSSMISESHVAQFEVLARRVNSEPLGADLEEKGDESNATETSSKSELVAMLPRQVEFDAINKFRIVTYLYHSEVTNMKLHYRGRYEMFYNILEAGK